MIRAYVSLGSNIHPAQNLLRAVQLLRQAGSICGVSPLFQTAPQGYTQQDDFLNMAVCVETRIELEPFKTEVIEGIEQNLKRVRDPLNKNGPRTIDLDISFWGNEIRDYGPKPWHVPDPDVVRFAHVIIPLARLAPDFIHPEVGQSLAQIAAAFDTQSLVERDDLDFSAVLD